jgi:hypothetical protein
MVYPRAKRILKGGVQSQREAVILGELPSVEIQASDAFSPSIYEVIANLL